MTAIEEIKAKIKKFKPRGLKENLAYRRYLQALSYAPDKREEIEDFVREHRIPDVFFEGEVKEKELPKYYRTADICCFPSIYGEGFGIVLLEAMASGKPVVAFANEGYKQVLTGKGAEFLVKPRDFQGLAEKLEILIKDENKRKEMGKWGEKEARKYCWEEIVEKTLKFYERVIEYKK